MRYIFEQNIEIMKLYSILFTCSLIVVLSACSENNSSDSPSKDENKVIQIDDNKKETNTPNVTNDKPKATISNVGIEQSMTPCNCLDKIDENMALIEAGEAPHEDFQQIQADCDLLSNTIGESAYESLQLECEDYNNLKSKFDVSELTPCDCKEGITNLFGYTGDMNEMPEDIATIQDRCMILKHNMGFSKYMNAIELCK